MPQDNLPPLRIREADGSPNVIPVFDIVLSDNLTLINKGGGVVSISATTSTGASGPVYAATGNDYVVMNLAGDLTNEYRFVQSGNSITVTTAAGLVTINATTGDLSVKQDTITYPLGVNSGGTGKISFLSYSILYGSGITSIQTMPVLGSGWLVVGSAITAGPTTLAVGSHGQMLTVDTGVAGALVWANTLGGSAGIVYAATGDTFLVYSASTALTNERVIAASDNITIVSSGTSFLISAITNGGGGGTQVISIPMALLSVEVNSGNAFWTAQTDTTRMDRAYVNHVDSGRSVSTWWCEMPRNVNATPAWGVDIIGEAALLGATGGFLVLNVDGMSVALGESANTLAASTTQLVVAGSFQLNTAGILSICTLTATNFDGTLATSAQDYVKIKLARAGNADTFNSDWYIYNVRLNCTVDT